MRDGDASKLDRASAAFGVAAAIVAILNTVIACAKDVSRPLKMLMRAPSCSDWTTQGVADVALFVVLGLVLVRTGVLANVRAGRLAGFVGVAVVIAGAGLFVWYAA